jgi:hypothetical protein
MSTDNRTKGILMVSENHLPDDNHNYSLLANGTRVVANIHRHNYPIKSKFSKPEGRDSKLHEDEEAKANAEYLAKCWNEREELIEALKEFNNAAMLFCDDHKHYYDVGNTDKIDEMLANVHNTHLKVKSILAKAEQS